VKLACGPWVATVDVKDYFYERLECTSISFIDKRENYFTVEVRQSIFNPRIREENL
jgi:hypothetical protein